MHARLLVSLLLPLAVIVVMVVVLVVVARRSQSSQGFERIVRCRAGHLFTTTLVPGMSLKAARLGKLRFERCPVGHHWSLVGPVDESTLSPEQIAAARTHHDVRIP
jgi:hypothetical protein